MQSGFFLLAGCQKKAFLVLKSHFREGGNPLVSMHGVLPIRSERIIDATFSIDYCIFC